MAKIIREGGVTVRLGDSHLLRVGDTVELVHEDEKRTGIVAVGPDGRYYLDVDGELVDFVTDMEAALLAPAGAAL